ncbi:MAG: hypothetical protein ABSD12_30235 [Paraburkholderia sp.]|jgi:hypothetical protein
MQMQPAITFDGRKNQQTTLGLLTDTAETYLMQAEGSLEMFRVISYDACGVQDATISAESAARILAPTRKAVPAKRVNATTTDAQAMATRH